MKRRHLTKLQRVRIFDRAHGRCHICGLKIHAERGEKWEIEHKRPLWDGGADEIWNMAPAHTKPCHRGKTDDEASDRSKSTRMRANHLGIKSKGPKLPYGSDSLMKKTFRKGVVPRVSQSEAHRELMTKLGRP